MPSKFERMLQLADDVFDAKADPNQIQVNEEVLAHLSAIHPACVSSEEDDGPVAWVLVMPTTNVLMRMFLEGKISEHGLYEQTPLGVSYDAIYLCSAMVLPEYRRKGLARKLVVNAVMSICKDHPIKDLFVWTFSAEGLQGAKALSMHLGLPLHIKRAGNPD